MHMADALVSPAVGITMWAVTAGVAAYSIKKVQPELDEKKVPLMGVMGAFVFAAQMINFTIPGTGSSGHLSGALLLSALLGPYAGFLTMLSVVLVQALFFADGGLLAYGANVFNMGFYACFVAYPLILKAILKKGYSAKKIFAGSMIAAIAALQLGSFSVVIETLLSGKTQLPFATFVAMMQPIHLAISIVEGLVTAAVVTFVWKARPEIVENAGLGRPIAKTSIKKVVIVLVIAAIAVGGFVSWFASSNPDGLEWSMLKTSGQGEITATGDVYTQFSNVQENTAFMPDYSFKQNDGVAVQAGGDVSADTNAGTSVSGIVGAAITLFVAGLIGFLASVRKKRKKNRLKELEGNIPE